MPDARPRSHAVLVAAGILASRLVGFVRDRAIAHYFGVGPHADVFRTALRGPNVLQNLMGEGTISAAFIPIYASLVEAGREREAGRFAGAIFGLLLALAAFFSLLGVLLAQPIVTVLAPGFIGDASKVAEGAMSVDRFALAVLAVRIIFPMTGILVASAWALGVLNSHRRFFLPYFAPVLWNMAIVAALVVVAKGWLLPNAPGNRDDLLIAACIGALIGALLQTGIQLPLVFRLLRGFRLSFSTKVEGVRDALRAFGPAVAGRGVYQISAYVDLVLGSLLATGAVGALGWSQTLYVLPVSVFGMSVAAAELPELSRQKRDAADAPETMERVRASLAQMAFLTVPTAIGYLAFGFLLVGAIYRTGSFSLADNWLVYLVLAGYTAGLLATTWSRLLQNAFYARRDTKTPARIAVLRVIVSTTVAVPLMVILDRYSVRGMFDVGDGDVFLGAIGLAVGSALGAWVELGALARRLSATADGAMLPWGRTARMTVLALAAVVPAALTWRRLPPVHVALTALVVLGVYATAYLAAGWITGFRELDAWVGRLARRASPGVDT